MKKSILVYLCVFVCIGLNAQILSGDRNGFSLNDRISKSRIGLEFGGGGNGAFAFDLGVHYSHNYTNSFAWDVLSIKTTINPDDFNGSICSSFMTGVKLSSPESKLGINGYLLGRIGYGYYYKNSIGGVNYELGAGINITSKIYIGYAYTHFDGSFKETKTKTVYSQKNGKLTSTKESYTVSTDSKSNYHSFRIGFYL